MNLKGGFIIKITEEVVSILVLIVLLINFILFIIQEKFCR